MKDQLTDLQTVPVSAAEAEGPFYLHKQTTAKSKSEGVYI